MLALIYGGSGSGKSELAENMLLASRREGSPLLYVATMRPDGGEARGRIARHQANRSHKGFATIERYTDLGGMTIPDGANVLLECLGNVVANEMFAPGGAGEAAGDAVLRGLEHIARSAGRTIVVTNDVFSDGVEHTAETGVYLRVLAELNRAVAAKSAIVIETVCGIPLRHKDDGIWNR